MQIDTQARRQAQRFKAVAVLAARAADDKKGQDIALLHIGSVSALADYLLIVGVTSPNHLTAVEDHVRIALKEQGLLAEHRDGRLSDQWRVLDYGGLIVHLMHPRAREFYALEKLFHGAREVPWQ
jgi:ribosome-associated protein